MQYNPQRAKESGYSQARSAEDTFEKARAQSIERREELRLQINALELELNIVKTWTEQGEEWREAE